MTGQRPTPPFDASRPSRAGGYPDENPAHAGGHGRVEPQLGFDEVPLRASGDGFPSRDVPPVNDPYAPHQPHHLDGLPEVEAPFPQMERDAQPFDDEGYEEAYDEPPRKRSGGLTMVGVVFGIVLVAGASIAGYRFFASDSLVMKGEPPLIKADSSPIKIIPESTTPTDNAAQNKLIYERIEGANAANANVVASAEEPVERPPAVPRDVSRVILPGGPQNNSAAQGKSEEELRRVQTIVIKPETVPGTEGQGASSPENVAPILDETIKKPAQDGPSAGMSLLGDNAVGIMVGGEEDDDIPDSAAGAANEVPAPAGEVPVPYARPPLNSFAAAPAASANPPAATAPVTAAPQAPVQTQRPVQTAAVSGAGGFTVQLASHRSDAEARTTYAALQRRYPQILGQYQPVIQPANLGERGTYYRLRVGPFGSQADAATVCTALKNAGGDCIVQKN